MTLSQFRIEKDKLQTDWAVAKMGKHKDGLKQVVENAKKLLAKLETITLFDGQEEKLAIEQACKDKALAILKDPANNNIVDMQIAKNLLDTAETNIDSLENLVNEAKNTVSNIIKGAEEFILQFKN